MRKKMKMVEIKIVMILKLILLVEISKFHVMAMPTDDNNNYSLQQQQTEVNEEIVVTAYPDTQKKYVDLNHVSPEVSSLLQRSNLNVEQIRAQQEKLKAKNAAENERNRYDTMSSTTDNPLINTSPSARELGF